MNTIKCICWGTEWGSWPRKWNPSNGEVIEMAYEPARIFWWWDRHQKQAALVVNDGEPEPTFEFEENLPFKVTKCSMNELQIES